MHLQQRHSGFTLLEMIIVVAIIGIMTAIAVPNYQEAVTRSKVSKFKGDAKTCEVGLEVYMVDNGTYPPPDRYPVKSECNPWYTLPNSPIAGFLTRRITTPIAYLAKLPFDPFQNNEDTGECYPQKRTMIYSNDFTNRFIYGTTVDRNWSNYVHFRLDYSRDSYREGESAVIWMIASPGPDMDRDHGSDNNAEGSTSYPIHYDATNGTVSNGDLFMFGPGVGFAEDR